jgi:hypothetical protein
MMEEPPAGPLVAPVTRRPRHSTEPPTVAAAPLKMGPKNGSTGVSLLQAATKSGAIKWRSDWAGPDGTVKLPHTCAPTSEVTSKRRWGQAPRPRTYCRCRSRLCRRRRETRDYGRARPRCHRRHRVLWERAATQRISRVEAARNLFYVEAELLDLVEPAREKAVDVPLRAQPRDRDCLVIRTI